MEIIERMFLVMQEKKIKSVELAELLGIHKGVISKWKSRNTNPPSEFIVPICEFLNVSIDFLLTGEEKKNEEVSQEEINLVRMLRELNPEVQQYIVRSIQQNYEEKSEQQKLSPSKDNQSRIV